MKSKIYTFLVFIFLLHNQNARAQDQATKSYIPNITVAPPQVASISKVGEIPIDLSTGRMNYTIPLFEVTEGNFTMPINLSYNYSGLLLDETPGYAGVGWTFNVGGAIVHSINGLDDVGREHDKKNVYNYINKLPPFDDYNSASGLTTINHYIEGLSNGISDGEPDKYSINAGNLNCSFYLDKDNNAIFLKNENYKVSGFSHVGFTITDDKGINYIFNKILNASKSSGASSFDYISSFLLTEINFPTSSNKIIFEYETPTTESYTDINLSQTLTQNSTQYVVAQSFELNNNKTYTIVETNKLKKIITNSCTVELQYTNNPNEPAIKVINNLTVKDKLDKMVKNYDFIYSGWTGRRTNLLKVKLNGLVMSEMEYDMSFPYPLIADDSDYAKKDLWGYYNKNGIPATVNGVVKPLDNPQLKPDFSSTKIGALTKITYQTKGYSLIDYEPNEVYLEASGYNFPYDSDGVTNSTKNCKTSANTGGTVENFIVVTKVPSEIKIDYIVSNQPEITQNNEQRDTKVILIKEGETEPNEVFSYTRTWLRELTWIPQTKSYSGSTVKTITVPGTYRVKAISSIGSVASITVTTKETNPSFNQKVGGMRVSTVQNCDFDGKCVTTVYNYSQDSKSTGLLLQKPEFYSGYHIQDNLECRPDVYIRRDFYNYTSIYPLSLFRGSPVLYKTVEKTDFGRDSNNQLVNNGKTIFSYTGKATSNSILDVQAPYLTGLLSNKVIKDNSGNTLASEKTDYLDSVRSNNTKYLYILNSKIVREKKIYLGGGLQGQCILIYPRPLIDFQAAWFRHQPRNYIVKQEKSTNYFQSDSLVQTTEYDYNLESGLLKSKKQRNSKAEDLENKYFYAQDAEMASEPFKNELIAKNMIGVVLDTQTLNEGVKVSEQKTAYTQDVSTSNLILPKYIYSNKGTAGIDLNTDKKITFDKYDEKGNILQYTPEDGMPVAIIWGYNKTQPIAKIENATYDQIASYASNLQSLSDADDDNCRSNDCSEQVLRTGLHTLRSSLPQFMVSSYTYNPLVGVTSVTDAKGISSFYEYDSLGRLKFVKDEDLNVLQKYCYNYKGQQVDCSDNTSSSDVLYKSTAMQGAFTKNNCSAGGTGSTVNFTLAAGTVTSSISKEDANQKAAVQFYAEGQTYANVQANCIFKSATLSGSFQKQDCPAGGVGSFVAYSLVQGAVTSYSSQADADAQAWTRYNNEGQANANSQGSCTFRSVLLSGSFQKNNCAAGGVGSFVNYSLAEGTMISYTSQADADAQAWTRYNNEGQLNANAQGYCTFRSAPLSGSFQKNNCAAGGTGSFVAYSLVEGTVTVTTSQADADAQAWSRYNSEGQANANTQGYCTFRSALLSGSFQKNNCAAGGTGSYVPYSLTEGAITVTTSQADADAQAWTRYNSEGIANANTYGSCTYYSTSFSGTFTKNDCPSGGYGSSIAFSQPAGVVSSGISQADADAQGSNKFNTEGQAYANSNGYCTFYSIAQSGSFTKNNCAAGGYGSAVLYNQGAGVVSSTVSQADADALGVNKFNTDGQVYANANGYCTFYSVPLSGSFTKNNCSAGGYGSVLAYNQAAGAILSYSSQADADALGLNKFNQDGQAYVNANGYCTFYSSARSDYFTKNNCSSGGYGSSVLYSQAAGSVTSNSSQADAEVLGWNKFNTDGQSNANAYGYCTFYTVAFSNNFVKNDCAAGGSGSNYYHSQPAGVVSSTVSQQDANNLGYGKFLTDGQSIVNSTGYCTYSSGALSGTFTKNNCGAGGVPSSLSFTLNAGAITSTTSQADADAQALSKFYTDGQNYVNAYGGCTYYNTAKSTNFRKDNCPAGGTGSLESYAVAAGTYSSTISQAAADALAQNVIDDNGQNHANSTGYCTFESVYMARTANKNNCGPGKYGSASNYVVPIGKYTSTLSQADANNKAQTDLNANFQNYANANGTCSTETYDAFMSDYDSNMKMVWITVTCNSASHPARTVSVTLTYKYPVNQNNTITKQISLPANSTNSTLQLSLNFVGVPNVQSYTVN